MGVKMFFILSECSNPLHVCTHSNKCIFISPMINWIHIMLAFSAIILRSFGFTSYVFFNVSSFFLHESLTGSKTIFFVVQILTCCHFLPLPSCSHTTCSSYSDLLNVFNCRHRIQLWKISCWFRQTLLLICEAYWSIG